MTILMASEMVRFGEILVGMIFLGIFIVMSINITLFLLWLGIK